MRERGWWGEVRRGGGRRAAAASGGMAVAVAVVAEVAEPRLSQLTPADMAGNVGKRLFRVDFYIIVCMLSLLVSFIKFLNGSSKASFISSTFSHTPGLS